MARASPTSPGRTVVSRAEITLRVLRTGANIAAQRDPPVEKASKTERELQAYTDELGIRHHAERLAAISGADRVLQVLAEVTRAIAARRAPMPLPVGKLMRK